MGGIRWSGNDGIVMNTPGTIGGNDPQGTKQRGLDIFYSIRGIIDFSNRSVIWNAEEISKNSGRDSLLKNTGCKNVFGVEKYGHKNLKFSFKGFTPTWSALTGFLLT